MLAKSLTPLLLATTASAHAIFQQLYVNGVDQGHNTGIRVPDYNGPITDVTSNDIICNGGINPLHTPLPTAIIDVPAGASLTAEWHHGGNGADPSDASDPIDPSHKGPIMAYLAKVSSALQTDVTGLKWFKIYEDGLGSDGLWAVDRMIANKGKVTFSVPTCIGPGNYLLRVELIALHGASSYPGAQFYMECAQINITGGGSASPATVSFPGAYSGSDPGILVNIYYPPLTSYTIPGPRPFTCGGSNASSSSSRASSSSSRASSSTSSSSSRASSSTSRASSSSSTSRASSSSSSSTRTSSTSSANGATQTLYGQCGGQGYSGPTVCASPGQCKVSNQYYSQCLP